MGIEKRTESDYVSAEPGFNWERDQFPLPISDDELQKYELPFDDSSKVCDLTECGHFPPDYPLPLIPGPPKQVRQGARSDINEHAYELFCRTFIAAESNRQKYDGVYVCFVAGQLVGIDRDKEHLLREVREKYSGAPRYFTQIGDDLTTDLPGVEFVPE